jgi:hypothetical protein
MSEKFTTFGDFYAEKHDLREEIKILHFEIRRYRRRNEELLESLDDLQKENIKLKEDIDNFFRPIGDYINFGDITVNETFRQDPLSYRFDIEIPSHIFTEQRAPSDLQNRVETYFEDYLDREILPYFKQTLQNLLHKIIKYEQIDEIKEYEKANNDEINSRDIPTR